MSTTQELLALKERMEAVAKELHRRGQRAQSTDRARFAAYLASAQEIRIALEKHS